ncbi:MAG: WG repeat-containing protein [Thermosynechococcaceae cyanobacterium]
MRQLLALLELIALYLPLSSCQQMGAKFDQKLVFPAAFSTFQDSPKFGFIDRNGKMIIQPTFESADSFSEGLGTNSRSP